MSIYRHPNKRIQHRGAGGRFRRSTLRDIGMIECPACGAIVQLAGVVNPQPLVDPRDFNRPAPHDCVATCPPHDWDKHLPECRRCGADWEEQAP